MSRALLLATVLALSFAAGGFWYWSKGRIEVYSVSEEAKVRLPVLDYEPSILLFWSSTCEPCKVEMYRLQQGILAGKIKPGRIFAISIGDSIETVRSFAENSDYQFQFFSSDAKVLEDLKVTGTPTSFHIDANGRRVWQSAGLDPMSVTKAEELFKN